LANAVMRDFWMVDIPSRFSSFDSFLWDLLKVMADAETHQTMPFFETSDSVSFDELSLSKTSSLRV
jgi:hypothetical protein